MTTTQQPAIDGDDDDGDEIWVAWRIQRQPEKQLDLRTEPDCVYVLLCGA